MMPVYLINLGRSRDRLAAMDEQLRALGIAYERVPAVDGGDVPADLAPYFAHLKLGKPPIMSPGAIGCYASHLKAYRRLVASGERCALILEDDAALQSDIADVIKQTLSRLPAGWDFVHLYQPRQRLRAFRPLAELPCGRRLVRFSRLPFGTVGYLISAAGAAKMLNPSIPRIWAIDTDTRRPWVYKMDAYGVVDGPVTQVGAPSTIHSTGAARARHWRRGLRPTPYSWTNRPLQSVRGLVWNVRALGFAWWARCALANIRYRVGRRS